MVSQGCWIGGMAKWRMMVFNWGKKSSQKLQCTIDLSNYPMAQLGAAPPTHRGQVLANSHPVSHPASVTLGWSQARIYTHVCTEYLPSNLNESNQIQINQAYPSKIQYNQIHYDLLICFLFLCLRCICSEVWGPYFSRHPLSLKSRNVYLTLWSCRVLDGFCRVYWGCTLFVCHLDSRVHQPIFINMAVPRPFRLEFQKML